MKRHITPIALLLVAIVLGVWLWLDRDKVTEGERKRREGNVFVAWRREDLSRIEIAHEGETIVLERDGSGFWRMTTPLRERADHAAVERLLTTLEFATVVRKAASAGASGDDKALGFESPRAKGSITMGTLVMRFALGGSSPRPEGSGYLVVDDGPPFVASKELTDALLARADTYRDRTVVPYLSTELSRFELRHPGGGFAVDRRDERAFKIESLGIDASRAAIDKVWSALAEMRAEAFPKDADADRLTAQPRLTLVMTPKGRGKPQGEIVAGEACPGHPDDVVILRKQPTRVAACAPKGAIEALLAVTPRSLVDDHPFSLRHDEIEELRLESLGPETTGGAPRALEIARRGNGFHQREPVDRELSGDEADAASDLLSRIERGVALEVEPGGAPFVAVARARVHGGEAEEKVEIGASKAPDSAGRVVVRRLKDDARLVVTEAVARRLRPRATSFRSHALLSETRKVKRVILRCGTEQELVDEGAGLRLVKPSGYETDGSIVQLVDGLVKGKVLEWADDADDGSFGLGSANGCRVVLGFEDGNAPATIRFGAEGEGGVYGSVDGRADVFVAPLALKTLVSRVYVSHAALRVEASRIESVKVTSRQPMTPRDPAGLREAAAGLFADHAVTTTSSDVGQVDVEITVALTEGGPPKRIVCGPAMGAWRRCAASDVKAVFEVQAVLVRRFFAGADASADH